jgi:hypothetical protein
MQIKIAGASSVFEWEGCAMWQSMDWEAAVNVGTDIMYADFDHQGLHQGKRVAPIGFPLWLHCIARMMLPIWPLPAAEQQRAAKTIFPDLLTSAHIEGPSAALLACRVHGIGRVEAGPKERAFQKKTSI